VGWHFSQYSNWAAGWKTNESFDSCWKQDIFSAPQFSDLFCMPSTLIVNGKKELFIRGKAKSYHSPQTSVEIKNERSYASTFPYTVDGAQGQL
jgi:hypothetical protein